MEPVILSFGAAFAALGLKDQTRHDAQLFDVKGWFKNKFEINPDMSDVISDEPSDWEKDFEKASPEDKIRL